MTLAQEEARLIAEKLVKPDECVFFGSPELAKQYKRDGYRPIMEDGAQVEFDGLMAYARKK